MTADTQNFNLMLRPSMQTLRFFAISLVIINHSGLSTHGPHGSSFFLALSGFIFTRLFLAEFEASKRIDIQNFYLRRLTRILPAYFIAVLFAWAARILLGAPLDPWQLLATLTFTGNYYNAAHGHPENVLSSFWTMALLEQFYLLWPAFFMITRRRGIKTLVAGLALASLFPLIWRSIAMIIWNPGSAYLYNVFEARLDAITLGCLMAAALELPRLKAILSKTLLWGFGPIVTGVAIYWTGGWQGHLRFSMGMSIHSLLLGLLIAQFSLLGSHRFWKWLEHPALIYLGSISFSMYLYHTWGMAAAKRLPVFSLYDYTAGVILITIVMASGSYFLIERPSRDLKRFLLKT